MEQKLTDYDLLVVSDLHLSEGRNPKTKTISRNEDFFFDEEFARFLIYHQDHSRKSDRKWHLIINGDFLDFLQVTSTDIGAKTAKDAFGVLSCDRQKPKYLKYGFGCGAKETVFKLWKIMDGHWQFFEALAEFVADGHMVSIHSGNHDVEFIYEQVQQAFVPKLRKIYEDKLTREKDPEKTRKLLGFVSACQANAVRFRHWFYYEKGLLWVEHGNQYDKLNCFKYWLAPQLPDLPKMESRHKNEIDLPWGSIFVRYLFNKVERVEPFADNIKPQTKFISWFLRRHPGLATRFFYGDGRYMLKKMRRAWKRVPKNAYAEREKEHAARLSQLASDWNLQPDDLRYIDSLRSPNVLKEEKVEGWIWKLFRLLVRYRLLLLGVTTLLLLGVALIVFLIWCLLAGCFPEAVRYFVGGRVFSAVGQSLGHRINSFFEWSLFIVLILGTVAFIHWFLREVPKEELSDLARAAPKISTRLGVRYVIMGHTHDTDLQPIDANRQEYFNTGTWTKVFSEEERLIREESELVFAKGVRQNGGLKLKLLKWDDPAGEPRLVKLFD